MNQNDVVEQMKRVIAERDAINRSIEINNLKRQELIKSAIDNQRHEHAQEHVQVQNKFLIVAGVITFISSCLMIYGLWR